MLQWPNHMWRIVSIRAGHQSSLSTRHRVCWGFPAFKWKAESLHVKLVIAWKTTQAWKGWMRSQLWHATPNSMTNITSYSWTKCLKEIFHTLLKTEVGALVFQFPSPVVMAVEVDSYDKPYGIPYSKNNIKRMAVKVWGSKTVGKKKLEKKADVTTTATTTKKILLILTICVKTLSPKHFAL